MVSERLQGLLMNKDLITRLGGDEFVVVLSNIKHPREAVHMAEKINTALNRSFLINSHEVYISSSIGISFYPADGDDQEILLKKADKAMYAAKNKGSNQYEIYHDEIDHSNLEKIKMEAHLRKALDKNELYLVYQPLINPINGKVEAIEALCRWRNEFLGNVPPGEFIPLAEETGLIIQINDWVFNKACEDIKYLNTNGFTGIRMAVNISPIQFHQENFVKKTRQVLEHTNIPGRLIELELTEGMIMPQAVQVNPKLIELKKLGLKLAIDDFGTGYSSLSYLNRFPLDKLKIDQSFIRNIGKYEDDASITEAIIKMAHHLHLQVVAEGVESEKQYRFLKRHGCDYMQGYYFSPPIELVQLVELLEEWDPSLLMIG